MRKILLTWIVVLISMGLMAQQEPQFNQYMFNQVAVNPAAAGVNGAVCFTGFYRNQWIGMEDSTGAVNPRTLGLTFDMPLYAIKSGVGLNFWYGMLGAEKNTTIKLDYAYHQVFSNNHMLSFGLDIGILSKTIDYSALDWENDPSLPTTKESGTITDFGLGVHYNIPRKFYAGFSVKNILGSQAEIGGPEFDLARHYYLMAGYDFQLEDKWRRPIVVTPGFLLKATQGAVEVDLNTIVTWNDLVWGGVMFRTGRAVGLLAGITYNGVTAGVSWDYTLNSTFAQGSRNSIEVFVKYCYPIFPGVVKRSAYNTRNL
jgi:type IX secretion system PorP/SprF family membrane protein